MVSLRSQRNSAQLLYSTGVQRLAFRSKVELYNWAKQAINNVHECVSVHKWEVGISVNEFAIMHELKIASSYCPMYK